MTQRQLDLRITDTPAPWSSAAATWGSAEQSSSSLGSLGSFSSGDLTRQLSQSSLPFGSHPGVTSGQAGSPVWGWLVPARSCDPPIRTMELSWSDERRFSVGRNHHCNIVLLQSMLESRYNESNGRKFIDEISRVHFEIFRRDNCCYIVDRSSNGTFLNGNRQRLNVNSPTPLHHLSCISVINNESENELFCYVDAKEHFQTKEIPMLIQSKYIVGRTIGSGSFSVVKIGFSRSSFEPVALKFLKQDTWESYISSLQPKQLCSSFLEESFLSAEQTNEVEILKTLLHPCITRLLEVARSPSHLVIVMEYAEGRELGSQVIMDKTMGRLSEETAKVQFFQICHAVAYLHSQHICHRDIKLQNILLMTPDPRALIKLSDFGLSKIWGDDKNLETFVGTPYTIAPDVIAVAGEFSSFSDVSNTLSQVPNPSKVSYTSKCDCWSLGVVLYQLLSGELPFEDPHLKSKIMSGSFRPMKGGQWDMVSGHATDLVVDILRVRPELRPSAAEMLHAPWFLQAGEAVCEEVGRKMFGDTRSRSDCRVFLPTEHCCPSPPDTASLTPSTSATSSHLGEEATLVEEMNGSSTVEEVIVSNSEDEAGREMLVGNTAGAVAAEPLPLSPPQQSQKEAVERSPELSNIRARLRPRKERPPVVAGMATPGRPAKRKVEQEREKEEEPAKRVAFLLPSKGGYEGMPAKKRRRVSAAATAAAVEPGFVPRRSRRFTGDGK